MDSLTCVAHRRERERERERDRDTSKEENTYFGVLSYTSYTDEVLMGFIPLEGFPRYILCLSCDCVSFSDSAYVTVVNLDQTLMISSLAYEILTIHGFIWLENYFTFCWIGL